MKPVEHAVLGVLSLGESVTPVHVPSGLTPPGAPVLGLPPLKPLAVRSGAP